MNEQQALGFAAMQETITNWGAIDTHLNALALGVQKGSSDLYAGALQCIFDSYLAVRRSGVAPRFVDKTLDAFMQSGPATMAATLTQHCCAWDTEWMAVHISALAKVVHQNRATIKFTAPVAVAPSPPEPLEVKVISMPAPEPLEVNVLSLPVPEPVPVQVVGMPERVTETTVTYDAKGNIKSTKQTEKDAV